MGWANRRVFLIGREAVEQGVPEAFLGTPFLLNDRGEPDRWVCEYLLARRNGDWTATFREAGRVRELYGKTVQRGDLGYLRNRAYQLGIFGRWSDQNALAYEAVEERDLDRYAEDLEEGLMSGQDGLLPSTVNQYLTSAIDLLRYGARRKWRPPLSLQMRKIEKKGRRVAYTPEIMRDVEAREISSWYTEDQIQKYLDAFETSSVRICATILYKTGLRISEALALKDDAFPTLDQFRKGPQLQFITVKGKFKKLRRVPIDEDLVRVIDSYRKLDRKTFIKKGGGPASLLIGLSNDGQVKQRSARYVQKEFVRVRVALGMDGLSPHMLRHHYAAHFLLKSWRRRNSALNRNPVSFDIGPAQAILSHDLFMLKESLGHASIETTMGYLNAIAHLWPNQYFEEYSAGLDGDLR